MEADKVGNLIKHLLIPILQTSLCISRSINFLSNLNYFYVPEKLLKS